MFLFIVFLVPIYYSFCVCFTSYIFVCYSFHYKYFCNYPTKKKEESNSRNSCTSNFMLSQYSLQSGFASACLFHRLPHLWLSTMLLKVHHFISLHFSLFASHFAFTSLLSQSSHHASGHIDFVTSLASHFPFGHFITHTHSLSLSLSHFPFSLRFLAQCHLSASRHTPRPHITHLGLLSCTSAAHHTSQLCISASHSPFGFYFYFFVLVLRPSLSRTVSHLSFTSRISASHYTPCFAFSPFCKPLTIKAEASLTQLSDQATHKTPSTL